MKKNIFTALFALTCFAVTAQEASSSKKQTPAPPAAQTPVVETKENTQGALSNKKNATAPVQTPAKEETSPATTAPATSGKRKPE
ncbi:MAG: hypothetical protein K0S33_2927 [Bacteroidetes bacterium]|nr:hypothetical protein [Bacteroidota bacterium]